MTAATAERIAALEADNDLGDDTVWAQLSALMAADAPYIASMTLVERRVRRAEKGAAK
jgi:hypothetical protein